jgi:hypothetical protein
MGIFGKKQVEDRPIAYHAGVVAAEIGSRIKVNQLSEDIPRFGGSVASVLELYSKTIDAPALLNMLAIGSAREFEPLWDVEKVRGVLAKSAAELTFMKDNFLNLANSKISELDLTNNILKAMGQRADVNLSSSYDEGLLFTVSQVLCNFAERFQGDTRNGLSGQLGSDAYTQGVVASMFLGLLIACERELAA